VSYIRISGGRTGSVAAPIGVFPDFPFAVTSQAGTAKRVFLQSVNIQRPCMIVDFMVYIATTSAGKSFRLCIYRDNGATPVGGALVYESGNIAATQGARGATAINVWVDAGNYWLGIETEDAIMAFGRTITAQIYDNAFVAADGCYYDLGAFGAFTNPCPAIAGASGIRPAMVLKVGNWS